LSTGLTSRMRPMKSVNSILVGDAIQDSPLESIEHRSEDSCSGLVKQRPLTILIAISLTILSPMITFCGRIISKHITTNKAYEMPVCPDAPCLGPDILVHAVISFLLFQIVLLSFWSGYCRFGAQTSFSRSFWTTKNVWFRVLGPYFCIISFHASATHASSVSPSQSKTTRDPRSRHVQDSLAARQTPVMLSPRDASYFRN
jgi:hypothetical protein